MGLMLKSTPVWELPKISPFPAAMTTIIPLSYARFITLSYLSVYGANWLPQRLRLIILAPLSIA